MKYSKLYGKPQGNEFLYGNYILRRIKEEKEPQFWIVDQFETVEQACDIYRFWISENKETFQSTWRKIVLGNHYYQYKRKQIIVEEKK